MSDEAPATPVAEIITPPPADQKLQMIQSRDHPHYGELGWMDKDTLQHATGQYYFKLSTCQHGTAGCYVLESDLAGSDVALETTENLTNLTPFDPYKHSEETEAKLIEAFEKLYNIREACQFAGISHVTYYDWIKQIDGFEARMEEAKQRPLKAAKGVVRTAITSGDIGTAKWLLERKDPEFKPKAEVDNTHELKETRKKIGEFLDDDDSTDDVGSQPPAADASATAGEMATTPTDIS
jgi:transposase